MKIKNRKQLQKIARGPYEWLKRNNPELLNKYLPTKTKNINEIDKLKEIEEFCQLYGRLPRQGGGENRLAANLYKLKNHTKAQYLYNRYGKLALKKIKIVKILESLPSYLKVLDTDYKICSKIRLLDNIYGEYTCDMANLIRSIKNNQIVGHPKRPKSAIYTSKKVIRSDGKIYKSISDARRDGFSGVSAALKTGKIAGGYRWAYCDENGSILNNNKGDKNE